MKREFRNNIEDTTKSPPVGQFGPGVTPETSNKVLDQEARGAAQLALSDVLPTKGLQDPVFKLWGIEVGSVVSGDPIFTNVMLPKGWRKLPGEQDPRHMVLTDDKGRVRASIFYKAASYDRYATISPRTRYNIERDYSDRQNVCMRVLGDKGSVLFQTNVVPDPTRVPGAQNMSRDATSAAYNLLDEVQQAQIEECKTWLALNIDSYADPVKSWES